jgi:hypothetical protein
VLAGAIAVAAVVLSLLGISLAVRGQAQVAGPPRIEVSDSCAVVNTTATLTVWGSHVASGIHTLSSDPPWLPATEVTPDSLGNFTVTVVYSPTDAGVDQILLDRTAGATISVVEPGQCPTSTPPTLPCFAPSAALPLTVSGLSSPTPDLPLTAATWNLDYPGAALAPAAFETSDVTGGSSKVTLPANRAGPGIHQITVIAKSEASGDVPVQSEYWTFSIAFCQPPPGTTTTGRTTTTHVFTTTTTLRPTTTTRAPATTTTTRVPVTTTTVGTAPVLSITPSVTSTGNVTQVRGAGFPPNSAVIIEWQPGIGIVTARVGADGRFTVPLLVMPNDQTGPRLVHASGYPATVSAVLLVERRSSSAGDQFIFRQR